MSRILFINAVLATGESLSKGALAIEGQRIAGIWRREETDHDDSKAINEFGEAQVIDLNGKVLMAGGIDAHVHFRDPGLTHKADMESESRAALLGGITSIIDMPNTSPATTSKEALEAKLENERQHCWANYGAHIGATNDNVNQIQDLIHSDLSDSVAGVKVFMGSSTGNMLVDREQTLHDLFRIKGKPVLIHSEDEGIIKENLAAAKMKFGDAIPFSEHPLIRSRKACIKSTMKALQMAMELGTALHVLHVTTAEEVQMIRAAKIHNPKITAETSANYLWFCDEDYERLGAKVKCNPAVKTAADRDALRKAVEEGLIDTIGSDHAPHLLSEKGKPYTNCPSGVPSIQQSLSVAFTLGVPTDRIAAIYSENVAKIFGIQDRGFLKEGYYADLVVVDPSESFTVGDVAYKCGWSPYQGETLKGAVKLVYVCGELIVKDGSFVGEKNSMKLIFS